MNGHFGWLKGSSGALMREKTAEVLKLVDG
jgi:hypothetical protein